MKKLEPALHPTLVTVRMPCPPETLLGVEKELTSKAQLDRDKCWGYFPAMAGRFVIDTSLPASRGFAEAAPRLTANNHRLGFNFLRLSLIRQTGTAPFHIDSDAATALTGNTETTSQRRVWRLLLNLSSTCTRTLAYLDINPVDLPLTSNRGYTNCPPEYATPELQREVAIPPRVESEVNGVLFCSSQVLHTGQDNEFGHFVAGYGYEE